MTGVDRFEQFQDMVPYRGINIDDTSVRHCSTAIGWYGPGVI